MNDRALARARPAVIASVSLAGAVIAVAAAQPGPDGPISRSDPYLESILLTVVLTCLAVAAAGVIVWLVSALLSARAGREGDGTRVRGSWWERLLALAGLLIVFGGMALVLRTQHRRARPPVRFGAASTSPVHQAAGHAVPFNTSAGILTALIILLPIALYLGRHLLRLRGRPFDFSAFTPTAPSPPPPVGSTPVVTGRRGATLLSDARLETDPRRAIVLAYAEFAREMGTHGWQRAESETPEEYLGRLGPIGIAPRPLLRLTTLFTRARYSYRPVTEGDRSEALDALGEVLRPQPVGSRR
ncbi:MAG: DUF4129 domain-containing protein [Acidimicrobiales bacterium]